MIINISWNNVSWSPNQQHIVILNLYCARYLGGKKFQIDGDEKEKNESKLWLDTLIVGHIFSTEI